MSTLPNNAKAVIALTSWKARINTVGLTIFSLLKQCPKYHIVLTLSSDEFPSKEAELPNDLLTLQDKYIEILWIKPNLKSFKKWIFAAMKWNTVPVISADDDMIYTTNFADELYNEHKALPNAVISYKTAKHNPPNPCGLASLYPPTIFPLFFNAFSNYTITHLQDDRFLMEVCNKHHITIKGLHDYYPGFFHDEASPINGSSNRPAWQAAQRY